MESLSNVRAAFLDFFAKKHGHRVVPSGSLVPQNDPTLLFTNAGMVPFKNYFTGLETPVAKRAVSAQKCVRAGGKHNDLDNVGYTARHHTFFEMLGNFSFGDYFKEDAIAFAWELVTKEFGLPKDKLLATVYAEDEEAAQIWRKVAGFSDDKIIRIATSDNFWSMGPTGPCGPCSEIFYDHGEHVAGGPPGSPDEDGDRFIEIWNLVFMQYEQISADERIHLPKPSIDTGMGLERVTAVLQGVHDNYDIDLMQTLIKACARESRTETMQKTLIHQRVIADHLRSCSFLIADGITPSNEGRGYVLRRIMRRAIRHAHFLGVRDPLLCRLVPTLVEEMGQAYPELVTAQANITETLRHEEERFQRTLDRGLILLDQALENQSGTVLSGETAFKLYDTYGFPLDLTADVLREKNMSVDVEGFEQAMTAQKQKARASWKGSGDAADMQVWFDVLDKAGATEFVGYEHLHTMSTVKALVKDGVEVSSAKQGETVEIVFNQTPFYAQAGGQVGDTGSLESKGVQGEILDTQKQVQQLFVHTVRVTGGEIKSGQQVTLRVDESRRGNIQSNHSATHLLHEALRERLGDHVAQKGSLVAPDRLRFDFSHNNALSPDEIQDIELKVNDYIRQNTPVITRVMYIDTAREQGARALFGEKYGDEVRVVSMGTTQNEADGSDKPYSIELCGGTHVERTGSIGLFHITSDSASASGIRRIEALTGAQAFAHLRNQSDTLSEVAGLLKTDKADSPNRVQMLLQERKQLKDNLENAEKAKAFTQGVGNELDVQESYGDVRFIAKVFDNLPAKALREFIDEQKKQNTKTVFLVISTLGDKSAIAAGVTHDLAETLSAVDFVRFASDALGGKGGGGRPDFAQGGGTQTDAASLKKAIEAVQNNLRLVSA
jgi:alanyl-tRNA synthetase